MTQLHDKGFGDAGGRILVVDDESVNIEIMAEALQDQHEILIATSGEKALSLADRARPDLILLDVMMPKMDGYQVCELLKQDPSLSEIPIIFVTGLDAHDDEAKGLALGAIDYVTKPIRPAILQARVRNHLKLKWIQDVLRQNALTDMLTGLANRRNMDEVLSVEVSRAQRNECALAFVLMDIDHFKDYNDCYGHQAGDDVLRKVGATLGGLVRCPPDLAARYGGEEFALVLPNADLDCAQQIAERARQAIADLQIPHCRSSVAGHVTASFGVVAVPGGAGASDPSHLIQQADEALYKAKETGRNRVCLALG